MLASSINYKTTKSLDNNRSKVNLNADFNGNQLRIPSLDALQSSVKKITSAPVSELPETAANIQKQVELAQAQLSQLATDNLLQMREAELIRKEAQDIKAQNELLQDLNQEQLDALSDVITQASAKQNITFLIINIFIAFFLAIIAFPRNSMITDFFKKNRTLKNLQENKTEW